MEEDVRLVGLSDRFRLLLSGGAQKLSAATATRPFAVQQYGTNGCTAHNRVIWPLGAS